MRFADRPPIPPSAVCAASDSFEQERCEVLESVFEALSRHTPDPDEMAACAFLVHHLNAPDES